MAKLPVVNQQNQGVGEFELSDALFDARVGMGTVHLVVRQQLAARRAGTHATKNRALIRGGGAKPYRQKGTGRARAGTRRSPLWRGGATIFGPQPRDYSFKVNKKVKRKALGGVIGLRAREGALKVIDGFDLSEYKTKAALAKFQALGVEGGLLVIEAANPFVEKSVSNLPGYKVVRLEGLSTFDVLRYSQLVMTKAALEQLSERLATPVRGSRAAAEEAGQ